MDVVAACADVGAAAGIVPIGADAANGIVPADAGTVVVAAKAF